MRGKLHRHEPWALILTSAVLLLIGAILKNRESHAQAPDARTFPFTRDNNEPFIRNNGELSSTFRNVAQQARLSVVAIEPIINPDRRRDRRFQIFEPGCGFVIDPSGVILTNSYLVAGADRVRVRLQDGTDYIANTVRVDPRSDVAVVTISPVGHLPALPLGNSDAMTEGDWVLALGRGPGNNFNVANGIIGARVPGPGITGREDFLQINSPMTGANSGGPLFNLAGQVIGMNTALPLGDLDVDAPLALAIPSNVLNWASRQLIDKGVVRRGYLGVATQPLNAALSRKLNVPVGQGALVALVLPTSPAAAAKLQAGDVVMQINGLRVINPHQMQGLGERLEPGKTYPLDILRNGQLLTLNVTAGELPGNVVVNSRNVQPAPPPSAIRPKWSGFANLGFTTKEVSPEQAKQSGSPDGIHDVGIAAVEPNSPAAAAGLRTGMMIQTMNWREVLSQADVNAVEKGVSPDNGVLMLVRTPTPQFVVVGGNAQ